MKNHSTTTTKKTSINELKKDRFIQPNYFSTDYFATIFFQYLFYQFHSHKYQNTKIPIATHTRTPKNTYNKARTSIPLRFN